MKFGWISSNGLGRDSIKEARTDGRMEVRSIYPSLFLNKAWNNKYKIFYKVQEL